MIPAPPPPPLPALLLDRCNLYLQNSPRNLLVVWTLHVLSLNYYSEQSIGTPPYVNEGTQ